MNTNNLTGHHGAGQSQDSAAVVGGALASGGLVGAGLAILALQLPDAWKPVGITVVPALSAACALATRVIAAEVRRRYGKKLWASEKAAVIAAADSSITDAKKALGKMSDPKAIQLLEAAIARMQRIKASAIGAFPVERPWLDELMSASAPPTLDDIKGPVALEPELSKNQL